MQSLTNFLPYEPVLDRIAEGYTITEACAEFDVDPRAFLKDRKAHPDLQAAFVIAQEVGAEAQADTLYNIHQRVRDPLMARVVSENRRWLLSKRVAATYGDKLQVETQHNADLTTILKEAIARIPRPNNDENSYQPMTIEAEKVTISDIFGDEST
jgi:hypothetical protein